MTPKPKDPLWQELRKFRIGGEDDALSFTARLARENGWDKHFAERVFQEYLKFIFLSVRSDRPVTPSEEVDQVWHLHLTYSRSYWDDLCGKVLGAPLHHDPTKGGEAEGKKYREQYAQTLELYYEIFGEEPPAAIWPPVEERFNERNRFTRMNRGRVWVIKPAPALGGLALGLFGMLILLFDDRMRPHAERWGFHLDGILIALAISAPILLFASAGGGFGSGGGAAGCSGGACGNGCGGGCGGCGGG